VRFEIYTSPGNEWENGAWNTTILTKFTHSFKISAMFCISFQKKFGMLNT